MINIDRTSWHCRLYQWWYRKKYGGTAARSNLCPYVRVVLFWVPLRVIFSSWIKIWKLPLNALTIPAIAIALPKLAGYWSYQLKMAMWAYLIVAALFVIAVMVPILVIEFAKDSGIAEPARQAFMRWSFWSLLGAYFRSAHDRVCPEVEWQQKEPSRWP